MGGSCLAERLAHYVALTPPEQDALVQLEEQERSFKRGAMIRREHDGARELFIVQKGWLHSSVLLGNGSRQIMRFHFPGDLVGVSSLAFGQSSDSIVAVTDVTLCPFDKDKLALLFQEHPRLAALIFTLSVAERVSLADRLASIGRTSARARVASLLCEIFARLRIMGGAGLDEFHVPLTQEEIGDATGLTAVHVNRMMRGLVDDGLIGRNGNMIKVMNEARLAEGANFTDRYAEIDIGWLPQPR
ncbi:MAG: Crp/Fnr family transcriptional regulator [Sphingosinicella sp.]|nr:Crp/Fnr family transcriptional regulator [Sphingosinicella sp.]